MPYTLAFSGFKHSSKHGIGVGTESGSSGSKDPAPYIQSDPVTSRRPIGGWSRYGLAQYEVWHFRGGSERDGIVRGDGGRRIRRACCPIFSWYYSIKSGMHISLESLCLRCMFAHTMHTSPSKHMTTYMEIEKQWQCSLHSVTVITISQSLKYMSREGGDIRITHDMYHTTVCNITYLRTPRSVI